MQIIHPAHVGHKLKVGLFLAHPLVHAVDVAEHRLGPHDVLAVEFEQDAQHAVGGGVLRSHAQDELVFGRTRLEAHRRRVLRQRFGIKGLHASSGP